MNPTMKAVLFAALGALAALVVYNLTLAKWIK